MYYLVAAATTMAMIVLCYIVHCTVPHNTILYYAAPRLVWVKVTNLGRLVAHADEIIRKVFHYFGSLPSGHLLVRGIVESHQNALGRLHAAHSDVTLSKVNTTFIPTQIHILQGRQVGGLRNG